MEWAPYWQNQAMIDLFLSYGAIDKGANPLTIVGPASNALNTTTPNDTPKTVPNFQPEPLWNDLMDDDGVSQEWERSLDMDLGIFEAD